MKPTMFLKYSYNLLFRWFDDFLFCFSLIEENIQMNFAGNGKKMILSSENKKYF